MIEYTPNLSLRLFDSSTHLYQRFSVSPTRLEKQSKYFDFLFLFFTSSVDGFLGYSLIVSRVSFDFSSPHLNSQVRPKGGLHQWFIIYRVHVYGSSFTDTPPTLRFVSYS